MTRNDGDPQMTVREYPFDWLKVQQAQAVARELVAHIPPGIVDLRAELGDTWGFIRDEALLRLQASVLKHDLPGHRVDDQHTVFFDVPDSPWQHWKSRHEHAWWLRWLVRRRPVRTERLSKTVRFTAEWRDMAVYPWQSVAPTDHRLGEPVRIVDLRVRREEP